MSQKISKPEKVKKLSNLHLTWIILILFLTGIGIILLLKSKPGSIRYIAPAKPFVLPTPGIDEVTEESHEIKEDEFIQLTQPNPVDITGKTVG